MPHPLFCLSPSEGGTEPRDEDEEGYGSISRLTEDSAYLNPASHGQHEFDEICCDDCTMRMIKEGDVSTECTRLLGDNTADTVNNNNTSSSGSNGVNVSGGGGNGSNSNSGVGGGGSGSSKKNNNKVNTRPLVYIQVEHSHSDDENERITTRATTEVI